jgi:hypothetical protein
MILKLVGALALAVGLFGLTAPSALAGPPTITTLTGTLSKVGNVYFVNGTEADFGPLWYITRTTASHDYDGDGVRETIAAEIDGLVGSVVTLEGEYGRYGDFDVYTINGMFYRDTAGGPPPWAGGPPWARGPGRGRG